MKAKIYKLFYCWYDYNRVQENSKNTNLKIYMATSLDYSDVTTICSLLDTWDSNNVIQVRDAGKLLRRG